MDLTFDLSNCFAALVRRLIAKAEACMKEIHDLSTDRNITAQRVGNVIL